MNQQNKINKLNVYYEDILIGKLVRDKELVCSFSYSENWLKYPDKFQLSLVMPFQKEPFGNRVTLSFFENLLPEGETRAILEKSQHVKGSFDFLKKFGKDCAGAIIISPESSSPYKKTEGKEVKIEIEQIYQAIDQKQSVAEIIAEKHQGYLSIAGAQDKFSAIFKEESFYIPTNGRPTTHIIKLPIYRSNIRESVYNEYYCMRLAKLVGLNVPDCKVLDDNNHPLFITKRFDRFKGTDGKIHRIHQQDFCQAQGIVSEQKYEEKGGPSLKDNYELIKANVTIKKRPSTLFAYLDWICFNLLIGNNDSHSKNISFLLNNHKIELSPFYDLICTAIYPKLNKNFSFMIGDRDDASKIGKNQLEMIDSNLSLRQGTMKERILMMSDKLKKHKNALADEIKAEFNQAKIINEIADLIGKRCRSLKRQGL
ncbi:MAG: type II toxin-antitoxin system HipA family toxin [Bdellovibrionota bacterium]